MTKLMLDPDALRVESFATSPADDARATVHAHSWTVYTCPSPSCDVVCRTRNDTPCVIEQE